MRIAGTTYAKPGTAKACFAELLANGASIEEAAASLGKNRQYGILMLHKIRRDLGWQAI